jgi:hypothetical protein
LINCYNKETSETCVSDYGLFYSHYNGICNLIECNERNPVSNSLCQLNNLDQCYFINNSDDLSCISDCECYNCII